MRHALLLVPALLVACVMDKAPYPDDTGGHDTGPTGGDDGVDGGEDPLARWQGHAFLQPGKLYNHAHRGGARLWPEHTLVAYQGAVDAGADVLEIDLHATSDGVIVILHDDTVDRTTDGAGAVKTMTFDELRALDAGYPFTQDGGATYPYRGTGVQVPTLEEVLAAHPDMLFNIEIKQQSPSIVDETVATIEAAGLADRVILGSFYDGVTREIREVAPDILTVMGTLEGMELYNLAEVYEDTYQAPTPLFAAPVEFSGLVMTEDLVAKANRVGVHIHAWTVNDRAEMEAVFDMGAEGIITDDPVTLADVIAGRSR